LEAIQIERLGLQAARRQAEIEAEEERRRLEAERQDRVTWDATGAAGDEAGLRTYLRRYPEGLFAEQARAQLAEIEAAQRAEAEARARDAWAATEGEGTVAAYEAFIGRFPDTSFAALARERIASIRAEEARQVQQSQQTEADQAATVARAAEQALGLPQITTLLVERRLAQLGLQPGTTDGRLDQAARQAIRAFQQGNGLPATGFLSVETLTAMLVDLGGFVLPGD